MKKRVIIYVVIALVSAFILGSCQSSSHCPAYSQADIEQAEGNV
jgi:hypothetical protein